MARTLLGGILKNNAPVPLVPRRSAGIPLYGSGPVSGFEAQMRALESNPTAYAIVQRIIEAVAEVQWCLYRVPRDGRRRFAPGYAGMQDNRTEVIRHPALSLWNQPNPFFTGHAFRETSQQFYETTGEEHWLVTKSGTLPLELWPIRPDRMFPVTHPEKYLTGWIYRSPDGEQVPLRTDQVIYIRSPRPTDIYRGLSPMAALNTDLDAVRQASQYTATWFRNGARPGGVIQAEQNISDEDFDILQARWKETHQGVDNANRVAILEAGMTWQNTNSTHDDMQLVELRESARETIREAFGFPKAMLGATDDVNKANAYAGEVLFARWLVKPRLIRMREALNQYLLPMFGTSAQGLEFDFVNPVPEDDEISAQVLLNKAQSAKFLADTGLWEAADILSTCGLPDMEELDEPRTPVTYTPSQQSGSEPAPRKEDDEPPPKPAPEPAPEEDPDAWLRRMLT
jgi:HK97 family phage portal protein